MPVLPVLIAFAALAAWRLLSSLRRRSWPEAARLGAPLAALLVACNATRATLHRRGCPAPLRPGGGPSAEESLRPVRGTLPPGAAAGPRVQLRPSQPRRGPLPPGPPRGERAHGTGHPRGESPAAGDPRAPRQGPPGHGAAATGGGEPAPRPGAGPGVGHGQLRVRPPAPRPGTFRRGRRPLPAGPALDGRTTSGSTTSSAGPCTRPVRPGPPSPGTSRPWPWRDGPRPWSPSAPCTWSRAAQG